jgi:hypothetical protein
LPCCSALTVTTVLWLRGDRLHPLTQRPEVHRLQKSVSALQGSTAAEPDRGNFFILTIFLKKNQEMNPSKTYFQYLTFLSHVNQIDIA